MSDRTRCGLLIIAAAFALAACSTEPTRPEAQPAPAPAASAPSAAPAGTPAATPAAGRAGEPTVPAGYRLEKHGGKQLYCKSVVLIGSKFPEKKCFTREQIEDLEGNTESAMGEIERRIPICGGAGSCPAGT